MKEQQQQRSFGVHLHNTAAGQQRAAAGKPDMKKKDTVAVVAPPAVNAVTNMTNNNKQQFGLPRQQTLVTVQPVERLEVLLDDEDDLHDTLLKQPMQQQQQLSVLADDDLELNELGGVCNMSLDESVLAELQLEEEEAHVALTGHARVSLSPVDDIDELDVEDPQCVTEYVNDIYRFLRAKEARHVLDAGYMAKTQSDINPNMRAILFDWLADVGLKFKLLNDTTHMTCMVIDRYLATQHHVSRTQLQLVGVSSMLVACKYEEIYAPEVRDFEYICDGAFTRQDILDMEVRRR